VDHTDNDGFNDALEVAAGTDPTSVATHLVAPSVEILTASMTSWSSVAHISDYTIALDGHPLPPLVARVDQRLQFSTTSASVGRSGTRLTGRRSRGGIG
jgi:hypothetical protein